MAKTDNIYLIGPMGAGKTSVGKQLSKITRMALYDTDAEIVRRTGVSISWIFEKEKEAGFRQREAEIIDDLTTLNKIILSTGGGSIVTPGNCQHLAERGIVIYLYVSLEIQIDRTRRTDTRPLLENVADPVAKLISLNAEREPLYKAIADLTYNTDHLQPHALAEKILTDIEEWKEKHSA